MRAAFCEKNGSRDMHSTGTENLRPPAKYFASDLRIIGLHTNHRKHGYEQLYGVYSLLMKILSRYVPNIKQEMSANTSGTGVHSSIVLVHGVRYAGLACLGM